MKKLFFLCALALSSVMAVNAAEEVLLDFTFKSADKAEDGNGVNTIDAIFETGAADVSAVEATKVYNGKAGYGVKLGSSSDKGSLVITLKKAVKASKIIINACPFTNQSDQGKTFVCNKDTVAWTGNDLADYTFELDGSELSKITVAGATKSKNRLYLKSLKVYGEPAPEIAATAITIEEGTQAEMELYRELQLHAKLTPAEATTPIKWESSNPASVTVSEAGLVKVISFDEAAPTVTITATAGEGVQAQISVILSEATVLTPSQAAEKSATLTVDNEKYEGGEYVVEGYVTEVSSAYNSQFNNISVKLADAKGGEAKIEAYRATPADVENLPTKGAKVRVIGYLSTYRGSMQIAQGSKLTVVETGAVAEDKGLVTVADFLKAKDDFNIYTLKGVVSNIAANAYGNFDLTDETGTIYIYGLLNAAGESQKFDEIGIEEGDTVTLKGSYNEYNEKPQIKNAQYVSHVKGSTSALDNVSANEAKAVKVIENGQIFIIKEGVKYNIFGAEVK